MPKTVEDLRRDRAHAGTKNTPPWVQFVSVGGMHLSLPPEFLSDLGPLMQHHLSAASIERHEEDHTATPPA